MYVRKMFVMLLALMLLIMTSVSFGKGGSFGGARGGFSSGGRSISFSGSSSRSFSGSSSSSSSGKSYTFKSSDRTSVLSSLKGKGATGSNAGILYKDFQSKYNPPTFTRKSSLADIETTMSPTYRASRRTNYYEGYNYTPTPIYNQYVYATHPSGYGIWDLMLFNSIMDNVGDRQMYYHHMNDPDFREWRYDANQACVNGDQDVCQKLRDLDREMDDYKKKGIVQNPNYVTPGVDPDIYEANNIDTTKLTTIKICSGSLGSDYYQFASTISKITKLKIVSIETNGSVDNLAKMATGECDMGFVQRDMVSDASLVTLATLKAMEAGMLVCPLAANIQKVSDLSDKNTVYVGADQTGSAYTLHRLGENVPGLSNIKIDTSLKAMEAVGKLKSSSTECFWGVITPDNHELKELDSYGTFKGVPIFSWDFKDKKPNYTLVTVDVDHYKHLTPDQYKSYGLFGDGGIYTIGVNTSLITPQHWVDQNKEMYNLLLLERMNIEVSLH